VKKQIKGIADIQNEKSETSMYVTNYEDGGYVIISADNRLFPVLAYSENGYFDTDKADYPGGLLIWMEEIQEQIQYLKENSIPQEEGIQYQWNKLSGIEKIKTRENDQDLPPEEETNLPYI